MQAALTQAFYRSYFPGVLANSPERIILSVVHRTRDRHRGGQEGLHLVRAKFIFLQPYGPVSHILIRGARVSSNEIRYQVLFLACLFRIAIKQLFESVI